MTTTMFRTARLIVRAPDIKEFELLLNDFGTLQRRWGLRVGLEHIDPFFRELFLPSLERARAHPEHILWHTNWQIILTEENRIIGGCNFKGIPDGDGRVEIGYGLDPACRNKGYMGEAVGGLVAWALGQPGVSGVLAETEKGNIASEKVLSKNGFRFLRETEECLWWLSGN
jgi:RimJ/RimL family protein N-acetyltransferase